MEASERVLQELLARFDHDHFRPKQRPIIDAVLKGRDSLAVLPTGSGKSLVYQLTSQILPGITVVVSPLIALMKDQVESLHDIGIGATLINGTLKSGEREAARIAIEQGDSKLLYVTPERFGNDAFSQWISGIDVSLLVVDEAHCISEWGHDFRPAYLNLGRAAEIVGRPPILALTATASPWVRDEILDRLHLVDPLVVVAGIDRPNLFFEVIRVESEDEDRGVLDRIFAGDTRHYPESTRARLADAVQGSGIVYTRTIKAAEETAEWLGEWGIRSAAYHGQLGQAERDRVQEQFMSNKLRVICCTNAFGLGVDKPDVRFVIHRDVPASVEEYFQEAGRAGRDRKFARCVLIYRPGELGQAAFLAATSRITTEKIEAIKMDLTEHAGSTVDDIAGRVDFGKQTVAELVAVLQREGLVRERDGRLRLTRKKFDVEKVSTEAEDRREAYERSRIEMMRGYGELDSCRRRYILNYFGEAYEQGMCEMCDSDLLLGANNWIPVEYATVKIPVPFAIGDNVVHHEWGKGTVQRVESDSITILFESVGYKQLANEIVVERDLLQPAGD